MVVSTHSSHLEKSPSWGPLGPIPTKPSLASSLCSGWIAALSTLKQDLAVSIIMMVAAGFFTLCTVLSLFLLKRVSGGCWINLKKQALLSCLHHRGVHHYSTWASWVSKGPAAFSKAPGRM